VANILLFQNISAGINLFLKIGFKTVPSSLLTWDTENQNKIFEVLVKSRIKILPFV
jgi:hypothetical protein